MINSPALQRKSCILVGLMFLAIIASLQANPGSPDLWREAIRIQEESRRWTARTMLIESKQLDRKGNITKTTETSYRYFIDKDDTLASEVLWSREDGKEVTEKAQENNSRGSGDSEDGEDTFGITTTPFLEELQSDVSYSQTGAGKVIHSEYCTEYHFTQKSDEKTEIVGSAWISRSSGAPVLIEYTLDPLPRFVNELTIRKEYSYNNQKWLLENFTVDAKGRFLFKRIHFILEMEGDDHFEAPPGTEM